MPKKLLQIKFKRYLILTTISITVYEVKRRRRNLIVLDPTTADNKVTLMIYDPNSDNPDFLWEYAWNIFGIWQKSYKLGDFNLALNHFIDTTNDYTVNNAKARERISKVTDDLHFLDYFKIGTLIKG